VAQYVEVLLWLAVLQLADLRLGETEPPAEDFLVQRSPEDVELSGVVAVGAKHLADVLAGERGPELVGVEEPRRLDGWGAEMVALVAVASAAQVRGVVGGQHGAAAGAAPVPAGGAVRAARWG
jgi:hypothetical protein